MEWEAFEHSYREKTADWFWVVGIVIVGIAVTAIILGNLLFAVLILISGGGLMVGAVKRPRIVRFAIVERGVVIEDKLYPFTTLESFWIDESDALHDLGPAKLILKSEKLLMPYLTIPLHKNMDTDELRDMLLEVMEEVEHPEPLSQKIMEYLGF